MAEAIEFPITSRRLMLARLAGGAAFTTMAAPVAAAVDPHPAWSREHRALRDLINSPGYPEIESDADPNWARLIELEDLLYETPARTLAGVRAQIATVQEACENSTFGEPEEGCLQVVLASLDRLTGETAHG